MSSSRLSSTSKSDTAHSAQAQNNQDILAHSRSVLQLLADISVLPQQTRFRYAAAGLSVQAARIESAAGPSLRVWSLARQIPFTVEDVRTRQSLLNRLHGMLRSESFPTAALYKHNQLLLMDELLLPDGDDAEPWRMAAMAALSAQRLSGLLRKLV